MSIRAVSVRAAVTALLLGAAWVCWTAGELELRLAQAKGRMIMLQYDGSLREYGEIEQSLGFLGRFPASVTQIAAGLGESRATALYWDKRYDTLPLARDASGELVETSPDILFVAANAVYRSGQRPDNDRLAIVSALDAAIAGYADVLRKVPGHIDAAYNYEYAVRARDAATRRRDTPRNQPRVSGATTDREHDLPAGPTIHGKPGAPPLDAENGKFRILVPMQPDERQDAPARTGEGGRPVRRG